MTVNGLTILIALATAAIAVGGWLSTPVARRRRLDRIRDRVGAALVAGYIHGVNAWIAGEPEPKLPPDLERGERPSWSPSMSFENRRYLGWLLEQDAYAYAKRMGWTHAAADVLLPIVTAEIVRDVRRAHRRKATVATGLTLKQELEHMLRGARTAGMRFEGVQRGRGRTA